MTGFFCNISIPDRVFNDAVVPWGNHHKRQGPCDQHIVILQDHGCWADLQHGDICVLHNEITGMPPNQLLSGHFTSRMTSYDQSGGNVLFKASRRFVFLWNSTFIPYAANNMIVHDVRNEKFVERGGSWRPWFGTRHAKLVIILSTSPCPFVKFCTIIPRRLMLLHKLRGSSLCTFDRIFSNFGRT